MLTHILLMAVEKCLTWQVKNKMAVDVWSEITKCISIHIHPAVDSSRSEDS